MPSIALTQCTPTSITTGPNAQSFKSVSPLFGNINLAKSNGPFAPNPGPSQIVVDCYISQDAYLLDLANAASPLNNILGTIIIPIDNTTVVAADASGSASTFQAAVQGVLTATGLTNPCINTVNAAIEALNPQFLATVLEAMISADTALPNPDLGIHQSLQALVGVVAP